MHHCHPPFCPSIVVWHYTAYTVKLIEKNVFNWSRILRERHRFGDCLAMCMRRVREVDFEEGDRGQLTGYCHVKLEEGHSHCTLFREKFLIWRYNFYYLLYIVFGWFMNLKWTNKKFQYRNSLKEHFCIKKLVLRCILQFSFK